MATPIKIRPDKVKKMLLYPGVFLIATCGLYLPLNRKGYIPPLPDLWDILCLNACSEKDSASLSPLKLPDNLFLNSQKPLTEILGSSQIDKNKSAILIEKSKYRLTFFYDNKPIKSYRVVFGPNPVGDKLKEGDNKTPEGTFKVKDLYPHSAWSKFIWLDYPSAASWRKHFQAKLNGEIKWNDSVGSEIGIHGTPKDSLIEKRLNWTFGCVSLKNKDVDELFQFVQTGTEVEIIP